MLDILVTAAVFQPDKFGLAIEPENARLKLVTVPGNCAVTRN